MYFNFHNFMSMFVAVATGPNMFKLLSRGGEVKKDWCFFLYKNICRYSLESSHWCSPMSMDKIHVKIKKKISFSITSINIILSGSVS